MSLKKWKNPFYTLLIPMGMVFVVTVFAYGFMAFLEVNATNPEAQAQARHPLFAWLNKNGTETVLWELAVLGVLTVGAIGTDHWWTNDKVPPRNGE
jgi:CDP-diglyceride synthetase